MRTRLEGQSAAVRLLVFDACRDASMVTTKSGASGMAGLSGAEGTLVAFASAPRQVSRFATVEGNSYYTGALVKNLREMGTRDLKALLEQTQEEVYFRTGKQQRPWLDGFQVGKLYLAGKPAGPYSAAAPAVVAPRVNVDEELYAAVKESERVEMLEEAAGQMKDEGLKAILRMKARAIRERQSRVEEAWKTRTHSQGARSLCFSIPAVLVVGRASRTAIENHGVLQISNLGIHTAWSPSPLPVQPLGPRSFFWGCISPYGAKGEWVISPTAVAK